VTYFLEAGRSFVSGDTVHAALAYGSAAGLAVLFSVWAYRGLRNAEAAGG
jgi:hypothetical protein